MNKSLGFLLAGIVLIINIVLLIIHVLKYNNKNRKVSISIEYKPVEVQEKRAKNIHSICLEYINSHFNDPDFSLERTAIELGFHQRVISNTIQELFKCNFKAYINRIRIHEAKRLLKETNLTIGEIAFEVGFNNQSHFNRVFKASEGVNPSDFKSTEI